MGNLNFSSDGASQIPSRHGSDSQAWAFMIRRVRPIPGLRVQENPALRDAYGAATLVGDPPMDALLQWMRDQGMRKTRPLFDQALNQGIEQLEDAPAPLAAFFKMLETPPCWLDEEQLVRGSRAYAALGIDAIYASRDFILMGGYLSSSINEVLARAGGLQKGPTRRLAETADWVMRVTAEGGMDRHAAGWKTTVELRLVHALVRSRISNLPDWRTDRDGIAVNQTDMVVTYLGIAFAAVIGAMMLGRVVLSPADFRAILHLFKYVHWLLGVEEQFLCDDPAQCMERFINLLQVQPGPRPVCLQMAKALADQPLSEAFAFPQGLRQRWVRTQHLSMNRFFLGREAMQKLELDHHTLPWYPLLRWPGNALRSLSMRYLLPGGRDRLARHGRKQQQAYVDSLYGGSARQINPQAIGVGAERVA